MIFEGLKLMLAGMVAVYVFLSVLLAMIKISAHFFASPKRQVAAEPPSVSAEGSKTAAVISAAVSAYRAKKG